MTQDSTSMFVSSQEPAESLWGDGRIAYLREGVDYERHPDGKVDVSFAGAMYPAVYLRRVEIPLLLQKEGDLHLISEAAAALREEVRASQGVATLGLIQDVHAVWAATTEYAYPREVDVCVEYVFLPLAWRTRRDG